MIWVSTNLGTFMKIELHHYHHYPEIANMSAQLDALKAEVTATRGAVDSAIALIGSLADQIEQLKDDPAALQALADDLRDQREDLAEAVDANDGEEPPVDEEEPTP